MENQDDTCQDVCIHQQAVERVKQAVLCNEHLQEMSELFKVLGDFNRIRLLQALSVSELCVCDLADVLQMTSSAVSHQLRLLRAFKIVKYRKQGKNVFYSLDDDHIQSLLLQGLAHVSEKRENL